MMQTFRKRYFWVYIFAGVLFLTSCSTMGDLVVKGKTKEISDLVKEGRSLNNETRSSKFRYRNLPLNIAIAIENIEMVKFLVNQGADIEAQTERLGMTPLMTAAKENYVEGIEYLLKKNANLEQKDKDGWTALVYAVHNDNLEATKALLQAGGDPHVKIKFAKRIRYRCIRYRGFQPVAAVCAKKYIGEKSLIDYSDDKKIVNILSSKGVNSTEDLVYLKPFDNSYLVSLKYDKCLSPSEYGKYDYSPSKIFYKYNCKRERLNFNRGIATIKCKNLPDSSGELSDGTYTPLMYSLNSNMCKKLLKHLKRRYKR